MSAAPATTEHPVAVPPSPPARRTASATWRDPRLVVGVVLVAVSVVAGAALFARADDTVGVWAVRDGLRSGSSLRPGDLVRRAIRFPDSAAADRYLSADAPLPPGSTLNRDVGAGELLPRAALGAGPATPLVEVPVSAPADLVPATVRTGSVVDVWVTPQTRDGAAARRSVLVLDDVTVVAAPTVGAALAPSATRQIIVGVGPGQAAGLDRSLALAASGTVVVTGRG